jgi:ketosteroid isomerase-like protein
MRHLIALVALVVVALPTLAFGGDAAADRAAAMEAKSRAFFSHMNEGDMDGLFATLAPDVRTYEPVGTPPNVGHDGVKAWLARNAEMGLKGSTVEVRDLHIAGNSAAIAWTALFTTADDKQVSLRGIDVHVFNDALDIEEVRGYFDPMPLMMALQGG